MDNSIRKPLIAVICGGIFLAFVVFLLIVRHATLDNYKKDTETNNKKFAQVLSQNITYRLTRVLEVGELAENYPNLMNADKNSQKNFLETMKQRDNAFEFLAITDLNGHPIVSTDENFSDVDKTGYDWFNFEIGLSPIYFSEKTKNLVLTFVEAVKINGEVRGAIMGDINVDSLREVIENFNYDGEFRIYLLDKNGRAIVHPGADEKIYDYKSLKYTALAVNSDGAAQYDEKNHLVLRRENFVPSESLTESILSALDGAEDSVEYFDSWGNHFFSCYQPVELPAVKTRLSLLVIHPINPMVTQLDKFISHAMLGGILIMILLAITLRYFAKSITDPIMQMAAMANRVRFGDLSEELNIKANNEIGELANNINHMIRGLRATLTKTKEAESRFKAIAYHDALTGLPNRNHFLIHLRKIIEKSVQNRFYGALLFVDVDKFKSINDTYGHAVGDGLLIDFGKRIIEIVGNKDCACRYGGDEFLLFLLGYDATDTQSICSSLVRRMREPFNISGHEFQLSASIGVALMPKDATNIDDLMEKADAALYVSKRSGRDQFNFYEQGMVTAPKNIGNDF